MKYLILNMPASEKELKDKLAQIVEEIKGGRIKYHPSEKPDSCGLPCLKCLSEKPGYDELTRNPVVASYRKDGYRVTVYFHEKCLNELLGIE